MFPKFLGRRKLQHREFLKHSCKTTPPRKTKRLLEQDIPFPFGKEGFFFQGRTVSFEEWSYLNRPGNFAGDVVWDGVLLLPNGFFTRVNHVSCVNNWCHFVTRKKAKKLSKLSANKICTGAYKNNVFRKGIDVSPPQKKT